MENPESITSRTEITVWKTLKEFTDLLVGKKVVLAVSGGPDSVAMVHILKTLNDRHSLRSDLHIAHFDHAQRGEESREDARFVEKLAADLGLPFHMQRLEDLHMQKGRGIEDNLRRARFNFLLNVARQIGASVLMLGHNYNDDVETVIMRFFRGSNLHGVAGIRVHRVLGGDRSPVHVIRPLLAVERSRILDYLTARNLPYRLDSSNLDNRFRRNWIRNELIPAVKENFNPGVEKVIHHFARQMRMAERFVNRHALRAWRDVVEVAGDRHIRLDLEKLSKRAPIVGYEVVGRVLRKLHIVGVQDYRHIKAIYSLIDSTKSECQCPLPEGFVAARRGKLLDILPAAEWEEMIRREKEAADSSLEVPIPLPGSVSIPGVGVIRTQILPFFDRFMEEFVAGKTNLEEFVDYGKVKPPLVFRYPRPDDRFVPLGQRAPRKLSSFLRDAKVPLHLRKKVPLVCDAEKIIWVVKIRVSEQVRFEKGKTSSIVRLSLRER